MKMWSTRSSCSLREISSTSTSTMREVKVQGWRKIGNLESKKYHEHDLFSCSKKASGEGGGARAVWSAEQYSVNMTNVFKKWMWGERNDTICWFFWMLSKLSGWPHDIFLIWIPYLGRGGAIQCRLCGTWGGIAAISAKEASKGPLGFDSWQPPLNVVICHIELKCFEPDSMFEWRIELQWKAVKFTQTTWWMNNAEAKNLVAKQAYQKILVLYLIWAAVKNYFLPVVKERKK